VILVRAGKMFVTLQLGLAAFLPLQAGTPQKVPLNTLQLNGTAILESSGHLRLTTNLDAAGSAFIPAPYAFGPSGNFIAYFVYQAEPSSTPTPADGLAFIIQNTGAAGAYLGLQGSGLGFFTQTIAPAIGVTFDYYGNAITGSPAGTLAIASPVGTDLAQTIPSLPVFGGSGSAGTRYVWIVYSNATNLMKVYYSNIGTIPATPTLEMTLPQDLSSLCGGQIYLGLSGGTGAFDSTQIIDHLAVSVTE